jgi:hypothetical protein
MGCKYTIRFMCNGTCDYDFTRQTNNIFYALCNLIILSFKYPIIDFQIRKGYIPCEKCSVDYCEKCGFCKENDNETI